MLYTTITITYHMGSSSVALVAMRCFTNECILGAENRESCQPICIPICPCLNLDVTPLLPSTYGPLRSSDSCSISQSSSINSQSDEKCLLFVCTSNWGGNDSNDKPRICGHDGSMFTLNSVQGHDQPPLGPHRTTPLSLILPRTSPLSEKTSWCVALHLLVCRYCFAFCNCASNGSAHVFSPQCARFSRHGTLHERFTHVAKIIILLSDSTTKPCRISLVASLLLSTHLIDHN